MLQKTNPKIAECLERACIAQEIAWSATDKATREFYKGIGERWMDLAASVALTERIDLYLHTISLKKNVPMELCYNCNRRMRLTYAEVTKTGEQHLFECLKCGNKVMREMQGH